jgi:hypothetical protein
MKSLLRRSRWNMNSCLRKSTLYLFAKEMLVTDLTYSSVKTVKLKSKPEVTAKSLKSAAKKMIT